MRFHQLTESTKVTAQDFYNAAVIKWGRKALKRIDYVLYKKAMQEIKAMFPGMRVLPKEIRATEEASMYDLKKAGIDLSAPGIPMNPYDGDDSKFREFRAHAAPLVDAFTKGQRTFNSVGPPKSDTVKPQSLAATPKPLAKPAEPSKALTREEVINAIAPAVKMAFSGRGVDFQKDGQTLGVRHWGNWEVPEGEEDDGDYDWEVPTNDTMTKARKIVADLNKQIPEGWVLELRVGEKNWFDFEVLKK